MINRVFFKYAQPAKSSDVLFLGHNLFLPSLFLCVVFCARRVLPPGNLNILQKICPFKVHFSPHLTEPQQVVCTTENEKVSINIGGPVFPPQPSSPGGDKERAHGRRLPDHQRGEIGSHRLFRPFHRDGHQRHGVP